MFKAIIFDFDGTLTKKSLNTWKKLWEMAGYDTGKESYYASIYKAFINGEISHKEWTRLTKDCFVKSGLNVNHIMAVAKQMQLIDGLTGTLRVLKKNGIKLHLVSGGVDYVIKKVLGNNVEYFDSINSNKFIFNSNGDLVDIMPTNYDFQGKAKFIEEFIRQSGIKAEDICFIGNGNNDEFAHKSGCRTICINPDGTDVSNNTVWNKNIYDLTNLAQILIKINEFFVDKQK